jgi:D-alanyl-D-alanine carboxypeptidase/D-alanyl-D-alanine-endopeptidase (penicillin-binding protein 4)
LRGRILTIRAFTLSLALAAAPVAAAEGPPALQQRVEARLKEAGPGTRFGLVVAAEDGRELIAIAPDSRFIPASNTKMFTTAAAFETLPALEGPDSAGGASVRLEPGRRGLPDVVVVGRGDARLSSSSACTEDCLGTLADAVAAKARIVGDVIGDDSLFPDQRWSPGYELEQHPDPLRHRRVRPDPGRQRAAASSAPQCRRGAADA